MVTIITGSVYAFAVDDLGIADNNIKSQISNDKLLINIASDVIDASREYYYLSNIRVTNKDVSYKDGIYNVDYVVEMDELLKAKNAMELPQMQGIAEALEIDNKITTAQLNVAINESKLGNAAFKRKNIDINSMSKDMYSYAGKEIVEFVNSIEDEYIGKTYPGAVILRANFDSDGNFIKLQTQNIFGEFTDDLSITMPESYSVMKNRGREQVYDTLEKYSLASKNISSGIEPMANTFTYKRVDAANYANKYSSNATGHNCGKIIHKGKTAFQDYNKYNSEYDHYCSNDCANYVSQAMLAGGVPTDSTWYPGSKTWINCDNLALYFTETHNWWQTTNFEKCNAGGIIALYNKKDGDLTHVMMVVKNDTVEHRLSAHTNDRKSVLYNSDVLGSDETHFIAYYKFYVTT